MGICLTDNQVVGIRILFAAEIAADNAGRDAGRPHQKRKCRGVVFTIAATGLK